MEKLFSIIHKKLPKSKSVYPRRLCTLGNCPKLLLLEVVIDSGDNTETAKLVINR